MIGSGTFLPGFEDGLIGHKVGEEVALDLTFPEDYGNKDLAGAAVVFTVKINHINQQVVPNLDDEFVKSLSLEGVSNVDEYRAFLKKDLTDSANETYEAAKRDAAQEKIVSESTFADITGLGIYQFYVDEVKKQTETLAKTYGVTIDDVVNTIYGSDYSKFEEQVAEDAEKIVKAALACEKIARLEKIKITKDELESRMAQDAADYGYASVEDFKAQVPEEDYRNYLMQSDVMDLVIENATVTEKEATEE
jgi:trigger factor